MAFKSPLHPEMLTPRFDSALLGRAALAGGMPVPAFLRDQQHVTIMIVMLLS